MVVTVTGGTLPTLIDQAKMSGQFGEVLPVVNTLAKATPLFNNAYWSQTNLPLGQLTVRVVGKPDATTRRANQAVAPSKVTHAQITESVSEFSNLSKIDDVILAGLGDKMGARAKLIMQHPISLAEKAEQVILYGAQSDGLGEFDGFMARPEYSTQGDNCLSADGASPSGGSVYSSILLVYWGEETVSLRYPKGTLAGVQHIDFGLQSTNTEVGGAGAELPMWKDWFSLQCTLNIANPLFVVRLANIKVTDVLGVTGTQDLTDYTTNIIYRTGQMIHRTPVAKMGTPRWVMPRSVAEGLSLQLSVMANQNVYSRSMAADGTPIQMLHGIPIDVSDIMTYTEAGVT